MRSIVTDQVAWSVGLSHSSKPCKNGWTDWDGIWVEDSAGPREPCIRFGPDHPMRRGNFEGERGPIVKYRDTLQSSVQKRLKRSRCHLGYGLGCAKESCNRWRSRSPHGKGQFWRKGAPIVKYLLWAVQKLLNWLICRFGCGLRWAEKRTSSTVFARWRQCARMGGHIGATWWIWLNCPSAAVMRSSVRLLWQLVIVIMSKCITWNVDHVILSAIWVWNVAVNIVSICLYVCPLAYLRNHMSKLHQIFSYSPWLCLLWRQRHDDMMYIQFCGWRHVFT